MGHPFEHLVGVYIGLLLLACAVAVVAKFITRLPYAIFLTLVGLAVGVLHLGPHPERVGFSHDLIYFVFLPPILFQGALHTDLKRLVHQFPTVLALAVPGVLVSTLVVGGLMWWIGGISVLLAALLFGALITPTDPVSVLALFREAKAPDDLRTLVEGESMFNDGTGVVLFTIFLEALQGRHVSIGEGVWTFFRISGGGMLVGAVTGLVIFLVLRKLTDHLLENAICLVLAFGAFWLAETIGFSGVIATVTAGLLIGSYGRRFSMSAKTKETVETFFESIDFVLNSFLFILIGLELREIPHEVAANPWRLVGVAILAMLLSRALVVYTFTWVMGKVRRPTPRNWSHVLFWSGLRGSIPIALLLHLPTELGEDHPLTRYRPELIFAGFSCVFFSLVVQGLTMSPLLRRLGLCGGEEAPHAAPSDPEV